MFYIPLDFRVSERLHRSPEFLHIYVIDYSSLPNNCNKVIATGEVIKTLPTVLSFIAVDINITKQPEDSMVPIGEKLQLFCRATNPYNKKMKYKWFQIQANGGTIVVNLHIM